MKENDGKEFKIKKNEKDYLEKRGDFVLFTILLINFILVFAFLALNMEIIEKLKEKLFIIIGLSLFGSLLVYRLIPPFMEMLHLKKHFGIDINKVEDIKNLSDPNRKEVPETLGLVSAVTFLVISIVFQTLFISSESQKMKFSSVIMSICFMAFLGFVDDMLDLRWRYKLVLPTIACIPIVMTYTSDELDEKLIPKFVLKLLYSLGLNTVIIGFLFKIYLTMLSVFCTNAINIYAGINGLEVGQTIVITFSLILYNLIEIKNGSYGNQYIEGHIMSFYVLVMFLFIILPLFYYNKYPSDCFIGDTFCYFSGITLACSSIIGNFPIRILLFFIPQILNFLLSIPQLIGIIPCPRHRLPTFNAKTKLLYSKQDQLNLLNQGLRIIGPTREQDLCNIAMSFQMLCSFFSFVLIYIC